MSGVTTDNKHYSDIAEKLREKIGTDATYKPEEMPSGIDNVYEAGKNSIVKLHPETTANGKCISVDDVSELPHNVGCQLSSDSLTDFSGVTVTRCGKNLLNPSSIKSILASEAGVKRNGWEFVGLVGTFTLSVGVNWIQQKPLAYKVISADGVFGDWFTLDGREANRKKIITLNEGEKLIVYLYEGETAPNDTLQLEAGEYMTEHEPYNGEIYTPKADGTVEGITSGSPYMNLFTDTDGVNIKVTYHKNTRYKDGKQAEHDRFWNGHQEDGARTNYAYGFYRWKDENFYPNHDIKPTGSISSIFYMSTIVDLTQRLKDCRVVFDTSKATSGTSCFQACYSLTRAPIMDLSSFTGSLGNFYFGCNMLKEAGFKNISESVTFPKTFQNCSSLEHCPVENSVIGSSVDVSACPFDKETIISWVNALSTTTSGQTITFKLSAVNKAFETSEGANDGSTSTEWSKLTGTKPNWGFAYA